MLVGPPAIGFIAAMTSLTHAFGLIALLALAIVPLASALGEHDEARFALDFPAAHRWIGSGMGHFELLSSPQVFAQVGRWLER